MDRVLSACTAGERVDPVRRAPAGRSPGTAVADLVHLSDPELIVFGGAVLQISETEPIVGAAGLGFAPVLEDPLELLHLHRQAPGGAGA